MISSVQPASSIAPSAAQTLRAAAGIERPADEAAPPVAAAEGPAAHVIRAMERVLERLSPELTKSRLSISRDDETGKFVYRSIDTDTGEVIRQWPDEEMLRLTTYLREFEGLLVDARV